MNATRIMVYSHDAFGLGNLRRMLSICEHLLAHWPGLSVLLVSGSPMIHEFRLPKGLDYIKLPCLNRGNTGDLSAKYLGTPIEETVALRSQLIYSAATHFKPHLLLVDKKPTGLQGELKATLTYLKKSLPSSRSVLLLRDILDAPEKTIREWCQYRYYQTIQSFYDRILVVGMQSVFDLVQAYRMPLPVAYKVRYCGYIRKPAVQTSRAEVQSQLGLTAKDRLVLVTPGGGEDGHALVHSYLLGLSSCHSLGSQSLDDHSLDTHSLDFHSLILCGPEMPAEHRQALQLLARQCSNVIFQSFTRNLLDSLQATDVVVSMGGYNTLTEVLSSGRRPIVIPRVRPSQEQLLRATRFEQERWATMLSPETVTPNLLIKTVIDQLNKPMLESPAPPRNPPENLDFEGLPNVLRSLQELLSSTAPPLPVARASQSTQHASNASFSAEIYPQCLLA